MTTIIVDFCALSPRSSFEYSNSSIESETSIRPNKKMCVSGYMLLKIRVGRSDYFFIFEIILFA